MSDQTHGATMDQAKRRIRWTRERDIALLAQVIAMGVRTFVTSKANTRDMKEEEKFNQGEAWTNTTDGILTMLGKHEAFSGIEMPGYQSVINHITGADGVDDYISTGMTAHAPVDFEGCHVQYVLGDAPDYPIVRMERRNVAMKANFRKALWSPSVAYKESGTQSHFNGRPHLQLANGQRIPIMEVDHLYALPRWTSVAAAEHARNEYIQNKTLYACLHSNIDPPLQPWASYLTDTQDELGGARRSDAVQLVELGECSSERPVTNVPLATSSDTAAQADEVGGADTMVPAETLATV
eukprot:CAMPEP_0184380500 /NCGR_PEP_ID=MMETSP0007-20130409/4796_1 /TAXON_ID=97485 /ORGANISM="Prymnesium parvum, Strain Texoma1" /LENGTH=295 /DNA_ID=CAMNT_0026725757 /DNA_START=83 /DNA_END=967 /DNA_ORIENTATION=-